MNKFRSSNRSLSIPGSLAGWALAAFLCFGLHAPGFAQPGRSAVVLQKELPDAMATPTSGLETQIAQSGSGEAAEEQEGGIVGRNPFEESPEKLAERMKHRFTFAPGRISVKAPEGSVPMGNPVQITLYFAPGTLVGLFSVQHSMKNIVFQGGRYPKIVSDEGNTKIVEVLPAQLGPVDIEFDATYSDNAVARQTIRLNVVPSATGLKNFALNSGYIGSTLVLEDKAEDREMRIVPSVRYQSLEYPIHIYGCEQIKFSIEQPNDESEPIIEFDKNCMVHALHEGKAYLVGDFDGVKNRILIRVYSKEDSPPWFRRAIP